MNFFHKVLHPCLQHRAAAGCKSELSSKSICSLVRQSTTVCMCVVSVFIYTPIYQSFCSPLENVMVPICLVCSLYLPTRRVFNKQTMRMCVSGLHVYTCSHSFANTCTGQQGTLVKYHADKGRWEVRAYRNGRNNHCRNQYRAYKPCQSTL